MKKLTTTLGILLLWVGAGMAQTITGTVTDENSGETIPGVNITVKGTTTGTSTDGNGDYQLQVSSLQDTLAFSFVGYQTQEVAVDGRTNIDIALEPQIYEADELVVSGYQTQRKVDVTGSITVVETEDLENSTSSNPVKSLQGRVPGMFVSTSGDPSGEATVRIRGVNTLNNNDPLYIIDGTPTKESAFDVLNPEDIESMQVLKDASSAAIYGSRASNGVIIVTTKQAAKDQLEFNYSSKVTSSRYINKPQLLNTRERARVQWQATVNDGLDPSNIQNAEYDWERNADGRAILNSITIPDYIAEGYPSSNTDWYDAITRPGTIQEHNLSMSTGGANGGAFLSLRYYENKYIAKFRGFEKISARINSSHEFLDGRLEIGENLTISNGIDKGYKGNRAYSRSIELRPILPVRTEDGSYSGPPTGAFVDGMNTVMRLDHNKWDRTDGVNIFGNIYANVSLLDELTLNTNIGLDWSKDKIRDIQRRYQTGFLNNPTNSLGHTKSENVNLNLNSTLQYELNLNKHNANLMAGIEYISNRYSRNSAIIEDFALEQLDYFIEDAGSGAQRVNGTRTGYSLLSYFGKINYAYNRKYLATITLRYDGSSRFGSNNRFAAFPSASVGWRLSNEKFINNNLSFVSNLKLRLGWGRTGNQAISNTARFAIYDVHYGADQFSYSPYHALNGTAYDLSGQDSGQLSSGFRKIQSGNENIKWETTTETNVGLDFGFFDQNITGSFDYFRRNTEDILISPAYIATQGEGGNRYVNGASVETNGFEVLLNYQNTIGALNYAITGNVGHYQDKITHLPPSVVDSYPGNSQKNILGHSMNANFGYVADGLFRSQAEVDQHAEQAGKGLGRIRYKDLNGDGVINTLDQKYLGSTSPDYQYGLNLSARYKNFSLSAFFQGIQGLTIWDARRRFTDFTMLWAGTNYGKRTLDAWTPENSDSNIPAVTLTDSNDEGRSSTYFLNNGSYLKLRQVRVSYTLNNITSLNSIQLFLLGENLLTIKDNAGSDALVSPDPENPGYNDPRTRKFSLGINLSF